MDFDREIAELRRWFASPRFAPFILGATNLSLPTFKAAFLAILRQFQRAGVEELSGHELYALCDEELAAADAWLERAGVARAIATAAAHHQRGASGGVDAALDGVFDAFVDHWQEEAGVSTYAQAVGEVIGFARTRATLPP